MTTQAKQLTQHKEYVQYLVILRRWWWLIVLGAILATATSYVFTKRAKPTYEATSSLLVNTASIGAGTGSSYTDPQYALMLATATTDIIMSHRVAGLIIRAAHLGMTSNALLREMQASSSPTTPVVTIVVRDHSAARAALIANTAAS